MSVNKLLSRIIASDDVDASMDKDSSDIKGMQER
jgi:hypothetical protein